MDKMDSLYTAIGEKRRLSERLVNQITDPTGGQNGSPACIGKDEKEIDIPGR